MVELPDGEKKFEHSFRYNTRIWTVGRLDTAARQ